MDVGETVIAAIMPPGESLVVEAQLVQERGVEVVHVNFVGDGAVPPFVGLAVA